MCASSSSTNIRGRPPPEDDEILVAPPPRPRSREGVCRLFRGCKAYQATNRHSRQNHRGYSRMGEAGEGRPVTHQQEKMGLEALPSVIGLNSRVGCPALPHTWREGAACCGGLPQRRAKSTSLSRPSAHHSPAPRIARFRRRWLSCAFLRHAAARGGDRQSAGADPFPTIAASVWKECSASSASFRRSATLQEAAGCKRPANILHEADLDRCCKDEAGAMSSWIAAATVV